MPSEGQAMCRGRDLLIFVSSGRPILPGRRDRSHGYQGLLFAMKLEPGIALHRAREGGALATTTMVDPGVLPEAQPPTEPDPVLLRAAEIMRERGLRQGPWRPGGPLCAAGAVGNAARDLGLRRTEMEVRVLRFARALGGSAVSDVHGWNDAPGRTVGDVAEALERAAYGL
jgi:hypothetical protein